MPKPKGWSDSDLERRDRCVADLKAKGHDTDSAYAICTATINKSKKK